MRSDIVPGGVFPDYALPDHTGTTRTLSELQGRDPLILTLAHGNYCPKEHQQHLELATHYPKIAVSYTQVATIATDDHHTLQEFRASTAAQWTFLSDPGTRIPTRPTTTRPGCSTSRAATSRTSARRWPSPARRLR
jgi:peroxiredoxin